MATPAPAPKSLTKTQCLSCMPRPGNEDMRQRLLDDLNILDTKPEARFDSIVQVVSGIFNLPVAYISLIDKDRQWLKAKQGWDATQTPRDISFCSYTILQNDALVVPDLTKHNLFSQNPMVTGHPHFRFYCGVPLALGGTFNIGTLCVADFEPRDFSERDIAILKQMAALVLHQLKLNDALVIQRETIALKDELLSSQALLAAEQRRSHDLLCSILPEDVAEELKENGRVQARSFADANVLFTDFTGFTSVTSKMTAEEVVEELNVCFVAFDNITHRYDVDKLKTIGDGYLCVSGLYDPPETAAERLLRAAFEMREFILWRQTQRTAQGLPYWSLRLGIHCGPLVAGVVGSRKFAFDVWGDTVNTASRFESASEAGRINVSYEFLSKVWPMVTYTERGLVSIKGKNETAMYFIDGMTQPS